LSGGARIHFQENKKTKTQTCRTLSRPAPLKGTMNKGIALALLAVGIVLIIFGVNATESFGSEVSRFFTGTPTDKSMWLLLGGIAATVVGLIYGLRPFRKL
jgi:hypothetical protein